MIHHPSAYKIAIKLLNGIGDINAKRLVAYCGGLEGVFKEKKQSLEKIPGISYALANSIFEQLKSKKLWDRVEAEIKFCESYSVRVLSFLDDEYPFRLKYCEDGPVTLFALGNISFNHQHVLSIVGTRNATFYGRNFCQQIISDFKENNINVLIVSGLAFGIDISAHKAALDFGLPTIGVLAHGLDTIYPNPHKKYAQKMVQNGGLVTDYLTNTFPDKGNFVKRNRIIAGLADATLVVESKKDGGAMITANLAFSYNRDVLALPGRNSDVYSEGPNYLIKSNKAALVENAEDICKIMGWAYKKTDKQTTLPLNVNLNEEEKQIINVLKEQGEATVDIIALSSKLPVSKVSVNLLNLEFNGIVKALPGKVYSLAIKI